MKTIEQACSEFCEKLNSVYDEKKVFKAGVEFAQQWIPVTDSLPEDHPELLLERVDDKILCMSIFQTKKVLAKFDDEHIELIHRFGKNKKNMLWAYRCKPIAWRLIEYK